MRLPCSAWGVPQKNELGAKRGAVSVGHSILIAYHILQTHEPYDDLAIRPRPARRAPTPAYLVQQLQDLWFDVSIAPRAPAA